MTLVEGSAFLICSSGGEVSPEWAEGLFFRDTRFLSLLSLRINGDAPETLARSVPDPYSATFVGRARPRGAKADSELMIERRRYVGRGMREDLTVRNFGEEPAYCALEISYGADFADLFEVKEGRADADKGIDGRQEDGCVVFEHKSGSHRRRLRVSFSEPAFLDGPTARWEVIIPSKGAWFLCEEFLFGIDGDEIEPRWVYGQPVARAKPAERMAAWRRSVPIVDTDHEGLRSVVARTRRTSALCEYSIRTTRSARWSRRAHRGS